MSADTPDTPTRTAHTPIDLYALLRQTMKRAEENDITPGPHRAGWILGQLARETERVRWVGGDLDRYNCPECGDLHRDGDIPAVRLLLPSDQGEGRGVLAGPFCPPCGVRRLRSALA